MARKSTHHSNSQNRLEKRKKIENDFSTDKRFHVAPQRADATVSPKSRPIPQNMRNNTKKKTTPANFNIHKLRQLNRWNLTSVQSLSR